MKLLGTASGRPRRLVLAMTMTAALAASLAACSSPSSSKHLAAKQPAVVTPAAAAPTASAAAATSAPATSGVAGTWSGQYSGAYQGTFTLTWQLTGSSLHGHIKLSNPGGTLPINGSVQGSAITFGTVGSTAITYTGSVSGSSMSGNYKVHQANGDVGGPWSASKSS